MTMTSTTEHLESHTVVLGGGPGGYVAALALAKYGKKVVLVERDHLGGTCLNWGCIPTKCLAHSAEVYSQMKDCAALGLRAENLSFSLPDIVARKNAVVDRLRKGVAFLLRKAGVTVVQGQGRLEAPGRVFVDDDRIVVTAENVILATGSQTWTPDLPGADLPGVMTSRHMLDLETLPGSLTILGGGVIGMEFAFILAALGTRVTVIEFLPSILSGIDRDAVREIEKSAKKAGISILTSSRGLRIESVGQDLRLIFSRQDQEETVDAERILVAVGRRPSMDGIDAEALGLEMDPATRGVRVDERMKTNVPGVYAIGDLTNIVQLAHVASRQGEIAAASIAGSDEVMDYTAVPSCIFTMPEVAAVGLTEDQARDRGLEVNVGKTPFLANGRALTMNETAGFAKVVAEAGSGRILGATIVGPRATDLVAEPALALANGLKTADILRTIHAHPTLAEAVHEAVSASMKR
ncbi:MAG: dihydrolipoyl dehydrogenase [Deltaproteobacteria bacterium]|nr:dihydrolipoyl dehydrogenase [Deltaproteobacteria bacterium]